MILFLGVILIRYCSYLYTHMYSYSYQYKTISSFVRTNTHPTKNNFRIFSFFLTIFLEGRCREQKIGFFGRFIAEKYVFRRVRKNVHWKKSKEKKSGKNRRFLTNFFSLLFIGSKNMKKLLLMGFEPTQNS